MPELAAETVSQMFPVLTVFVCLIGACIGSFLNVCIWRLPRKESIVNVPSHCPQCNTPIAYYDNIPVVSWLNLRGRCRHCRLPIPARYPIVEALTGAMLLAFWLHIDAQGWPLPLIFPYAFVGAAMLAITFTDIRDGVIPNTITYTGAIVALAYGLLFPGLMLDGVNGMMLFDPYPLRELSVFGLDVHVPSALVDSVRMPMKAAVLGLIDVAATYKPVLKHSAIMTAAAVMALGILFGSGIMWLVGEVGKLFFGKRHYVMDEPATLVLTADGFKDTSAAVEKTWHQLLQRGSDRVVVRGRLRSWQDTRAGGDDAPVPGTEVTVEVHPDHIVIGDRSTPLDEFKEAIIDADSWIEPREVVGMGDIKLMVMLGMFFGPAGAIAIMLISSLSGLVFMLWLILSGRGSWHSATPFGPFIAWAAFVLLMTGR